MVTPESIQLNIAQGMATESLDVDGDGHHFEAVASAFASKNRVQRHQLVYQTLGDRMHEEIHALPIKTYTPQEWESRR